MKSQRADTLQRPYLLWSLTAHIVPMAPLNQRHQLLLHTSLCSSHFFGKSLIYYHRTMALSKSCNATRSSLIFFIIICFPHKSRSHRRAFCSFVFVFFTVVTLAPQILPETRGAQLVLIK